VAEVAGQQAIIMAKAAEAAEIEAMKKATAAAQVLARAAQAKSAADRAAAEAQVQQSNRAKAEAVAFAKEAAAQAAEAQEAFDEAQQKAYRAALAAADTDRQRYDMPELTVTADEEPTPASASAPAGQPAANRTTVFSNRLLMRFSVIFIASTLGLVVFSVVLRRKPGHDAWRAMVTSGEP